jgi:hypothetical protein
MNFSRARQHRRARMYVRVVSLVKGKESEVAYFPSLISDGTPRLGSHRLYYIVNKHFGKCSIYISIQRLEGRTPPSQSGELR